MKTVCAIFRLPVLFLLFFIFFPVTGSGSSPPENTLLDSSKISELQEKAARAFSSGDFAAAVQLWERVEVFYDRTGASKELTLTLINLAETCQAIGNIRKAKEFLSRAEEVAEEITKPEVKGKIFASLGKLYNQTGEHETAESYFKKSLDTIPSADDTPLKSIIFLNYANLFYSRGDYEKAETYYEKSIGIAKDHDLVSIIIKASVNIVRTRLEQQNFENIENMLKQSLSSAKLMTDSHDKAISLISIGRLADKKILQDPSGRGNDELLMLAHEALTAACATARTISDKRALSFGLGTLGMLYKNNGQINDALHYTLRAVFIAQEIWAIDILYRLNWQSGQLYAALDDKDSAISAYRRALKNIAEIREDLTIDCRQKSRLSFREVVGPVYFELADLLLKRSLLMTDADARQADLMEAQNTIEEMKKIELQDYFQDECVIALKARQSALDEKIPGTAVIYPVLLPGRMELIVTHGGKMKNYTVDINQKTLVNEIRRLRKKLQQPGSRFSRHTKKLYRWLIRPIEQDLSAAKVHTLVFVPDGPLRTIPMSSLYDGQNYLIEKYAVATTPGLTITDLVPFRRQGKLLLSGLTEAVQGFSALPNVALELEQIDKLHQSRKLMNNEFINDTIQQTLETNPYSVVHIASHGQFDSDPEKTFLLTHDNKLTLDRLESLMALSNYRQEPVELLTLSACQTAVGDDRAALGLAGVAVKSGARSALASLWFINDKATSLLVVDFYQQLLKSPDISKARALQLAQVRLIKNTEYEHPAYWAPFLLIGNWL